MIVVINPSGQGGHSFKGLHAYCAHDEGAATAERVEWMATRNLASEDPHLAWREMVGTALAQDQLKAAAGKRAGRKSTNGPVLHIVLSFADGEPDDPGAMAAAADELLAKLGSDPKKSRAKSKAGQRQFADEHQAIYYAHRDKEHHHVHVMLNRVHPDHGVMLPDKNDQLKASKWALAFSKRFGTDDRTPAREENNDARDAGEYVKGERRKTRNVFEADLALASANDNSLITAVRERERKRDAALQQRKRNMAAMHAKAWADLAAAHKARKTALARDLQRQTNRARAEVQADFQPRRIELARRQRAERATYDALEESFFGRAKNAWTAADLARAVREGDSNLIARTFRILSNAGERKAAFERLQERAQGALRAEQAGALKERTEALKAEHADKQAANRVVLADERERLVVRQGAAKGELASALRERAIEKRAAFKEALAMTLKAEDLLDQYGYAARPRSEASDQADDILSRYAATFDEAARPKAKDQDNEGPSGDTQK